MSKKDKPLPKPPNTAFGRKKRFEEEERSALLADRIAAAMAEGTLEEFLKQEMPDNEYARNLTTMMMGMTGMLPAGGGRPSSLPQDKTEGPSSAKSGTREQVGPAEEIPEDVRKAIQGGDVQGLMDMLRREHQKRMPGAETGSGEETLEPHSPDQPAIDKDIIDALVQIASDNSVTMDWIILRAIKVYVEEYRKTGKL